MGRRVAIAVDALFLRFRVTARFRDLGERLSKRWWIVVAVTAALYSLAGWLLTLPWTIYTGFLRERHTT